MTSLEQLENETETSRIRVAELLEELRGRVSPGELVDQMVDLAGNGAAGEFAHTLGRQVRNNPLACVLIGAGLAWLMTADRRTSHRSGAADWSRAAEGASHRVASTAERAAGAAADAAGRARSTVFDRIYGAGDAAAEAAGRAGTAMSDTMHRAGDAAADATSSLSDRMREAASGAHGMAGAATDMAKGVASATSDTLQGAAQSARDLGRSATDIGWRAGTTITQLFQDQPLVAGGLGLAIGALIGAALPATAAENRLVGETSDEFKSRARDVAGEQIDKAKKVAEHTYEAAKEEAGRVADEAVHAAQEQGFPAGTLRAEHERNEHAQPEAK